MNCNASAGAHPAKTNDDPTHPARENAPIEDHKPKQSATFDWPKGGAYEQ